MFSARKSHLYRVKLTTAQLEVLLADIHASVAPACQGRGSVPKYIPELAHVEADRFGVYLSAIDGAAAGFGDFQHRFSIQSIAKVLSLVMAYELKDARLWQRVHVEPSGGSFNSLIQLELNSGIPRNPMLNAGALVVADVLVARIPDAKTAYLNFVRELCGDDAVDFDEQVAASELATGFRNEALVQFMRDFGNITSPLEEIMDFYCHICALSLSCAQLARAFGFLANRGVNPLSGKRICSASHSKRVNAIMQLCGFYDEAGEFAFRVGLPGKSGVGGGIVAVHPGEYVVAVYSPRLNRKYNSVMGTAFLEELTTRVERSIF